MKKYGLWMVCALLAVAIALPVAAYAQQQQPKFKSEDEQKLYTEYYNACNVEKNEAKCLDLAKQFLDKFATSDYAPYPKSTIVNWYGTQFQNALTAFYADGVPDTAKLNKLLTVGDDYLKWQADNIYVKAHMALAASRAVLAQKYTDTARTKSLVETALQQMASTTPPEGWKPEQWNPLRTNVLAQGHQYLGYQELEQSTPNLDEAIKHLSEATQVKDGEGIGWKDPNNYWLRATAYQKQYTPLSEQYRALSDDDKRGEPGKALLDQINPLIDKMIDDYARVVAVASSPGAKELRDAARQSLDSFWNYRYKNLPGGQEQLVKHFEADPLATAPERTPASSEELTPEAPTASTGKPALATGSAPTENGTKAAPAKGKSKPAPKKSTSRRPRRRG